MHTEPDEPNRLPIERFEAMLKTNQILFFDSEEFENIVLFYLDSGKMALAKKALKLGLEQHPASTYLKLFQVEVFVIEDKLEEAETLLDEVSDLERDNEDIYIQKANILSRKYQHREAVTYLEHALELTDDPAEIFSMIGMEYMFMDDYENALLNFQRCLEHDEEDVGALYNIVFSYEYLERTDEAVNFLNDFIEAHPYSEIAWMQLAKLYYKQKEFGKALAAIDFAIISDDSFLGAYFEKGKILEKLKRFDEAIENYTITLSINDPTSYALLRIGKCYEKLGQTELALDYYLRSVEIDSGETRAWNAISDHFYKSGDIHKAQYYIEKAISIDPEVISFWKRYAKIHKKLKNFEEAEIGYRKALELGNYELESWLTRSDLLTRLGEYDSAITNLLQALEFYPEHPEIEYRLSGLYFSLKDYHKGEFHLHNGLHAEPEFLMIIEELFPMVYKLKRVKQIVAEHKKPSH